MDYGVTRGEALVALADQVGITYDVAGKVIDAFAADLYTDFAKYVNDLHMELARELVAEKIRLFEEARDEQESGDAGRG